MAIGTVPAVTMAAEVATRRCSSNMRPAACSDANRGAMTMLSAVSTIEMNVESCTAIAYTPVSASVDSDFIMTTSS